MRYKNNKLFLMLLLIFVVITYGCQNIKSRDFLDKEVNEKFNSDKNKEYFTKDKIKELLSIEDEIVFIDKVIGSMKTRRFSFPFVGPLYDREYNFNKIQSRMITGGSMKNNSEKVLLIYTEVNKDNNEDYVLELLLGKYRMFHKLISYMRTSLSDEIVNEFLNFLPNEKLSILAMYAYEERIVKADMKWKPKDILQLLNLANESDFIELKPEDLIRTHQKLDYKEFVELYNNLNKDNYEELLLKNPGFSPINEVEKNIESLKYYFELMEMKEK